MTMRAFALLIMLWMPAAGAEAAELFGGVYAHDVDTFLSKGGFEDGVEIQIGIRGAPIEALRAVGRPSLYAFASVSASGETNFAVAGLGWKFGDRLYFRPSVGVAIHDRSDDVVIDGRRADFGSRILFAPEIAIGYGIGESVSVEASWVHLSHGQLLSRQNPGMDSIGMRLNYRFR